MDDLMFGTRNKRGDWTPSGRLEIAPFWAWPPKLLAVLRWLPEYVWPWNAFHMADTASHEHGRARENQTLKNFVREGDRYG